MRKFSKELNDTKKKEAENYHRLFQVMVEVLANHYNETPWERFVGIFKWEGGVNVGEREICIKSWYVRDDWNESIGINAEINTVKAIEHILDEFDFSLLEEEKEETAEDKVYNFFVNQGIDADEIMDEVEQGCSNPFADPLRSFFED